MLDYIGKLIDIKALREDIRKIGINFITAGIVGVFINYYVGLLFPTMLWASLSITILGILSLYLGLLKRQNIQ